MKKPRKRSPRWKDVVAYLSMRIEACDAVGDTTHADWLRQLLVDMARYTQR